MATPLQITLPEPLEAYVEAQVASGAYGIPVDVVRELILDDRDRHLARLKDRLLEHLKGKPIDSSESLYFTCAGTLPASWWLLANSSSP